MRLLSVITKSILSVTAATTVISSAALAQVDGVPTGTPPRSTYAPSPIRIESAHITCVHKLQIAAQTDGIIKQLDVDEGFTVRKGAELFVVDSRVAEAQQRVAQKELEAAEKQASTTANVEYAEAASDVAVTEWQDERELYRLGSTTYSSLNRKHLEMKRAKLGVNVAIVEHEKEILAADVAREKLNAAKVELELFRVIAPFDGIIVHRHRDQGEWIRAGEQVLKMVNMDEMKVEAHIPTDNVSIAELEGAPVKVVVLIDPRTNQTATLSGKLDFVSPEIESRRVRVWAKIANSELADGKWLLRDGMVATLILNPQD